MDDLVAMLRELNPLLGHGGGKTVNEAADAIERLSAERDKLKHDLKMAFSEDDKLIVMKQMQTEINAYKERIAELEKDKADFHMQYRMKCDEETKRLELRIALLESGQPCEVRGEMWQLVRVEASENELVAIGETMALQDGADPHQLIWQGNPPEPYGEILHTYFSKAREIRAAMLAADKATPR